MIYLGIIVAIVIIETLIKRKMEQQKPDGELVCGGHIKLKLHHNDGAIFDSMRTKQTLVFIGAAVLTVLLTIYFICTLGEKGQVLRKAGLSLLLGGAYSNTYDRLRKKYVTDYFMFQTGWKRLDKIIFNLSDLAIMIGAVLVALGWK